MAKQDKKQDKLPRLSRVEFFRFRENELASSLAGAIADHVDRILDAELMEYRSAIAARSAAAINVPNVVLRLACTQEEIDMSHRPFPSAVVFVADVRYVGDFYRKVAAMATVQEDREHAVLELDGFQGLRMTMTSSSATPTKCRPTIRPQPSSTYLPDLTIRCLGKPSQRPNQAMQ